MMGITRLMRGLTIARVVLQHGLHELVPAHLDPLWLKPVRALLRLGRTSDASRGVRLREALEGLGPIFVKFGQVLSTRRDLLPTDIADELAKLQDRVPPFDSRIAVATIEKAFGKSVREVFDHFDDTPVASASIAQVHFAVLKTKNDALREVAVKVLRPNMQSVIEKDMALLRTLAGWVERWSADGKRLKPLEVVAEFDKYLHDELDLVREAANAAQLRRNMGPLELLRIPEMFWDWCAQDVIVMERMKGVPIGQTERLREAGVDLKKLARDGIVIFFNQVFRDGFFHADMHPGNIMVTVDAPKDSPLFGRYIALDFGIVGTLTAHDKDYLAQNFAAFFRRDYKRVAELHIESGWVPASTRVDELESAVRSCCEPYFDKPLKEISLGMVLMRLFQASRRFSVEIQPQLVLLQKTLLNVEGLGRELDPDLDLWATAKPFLETWMREQIGPEKLREALAAQAPRYAQLIPELPQLLHQFLRERQGQGAAMQQLIEETQRTQVLIQRIVWVGVGFALGVGLLALWIRL